MVDVIGFFGGDHQMGTTMVAWSFGESLAEQGKRVLFILGSGNNDEGILRHQQGYCIDDLKASLRTGYLEKEELMQILDKRKNLWILPGIKNSLTAFHFPENTFEILLDTVEDTFDVIVIDGGSNLHMGLTVSALNVCTQRYFLVTQQPKSIHRFVQCKTQFYEPLGIGGILIINKYQKDPSFLLKKDILRITGEDEGIVLPYVDSGLQAEMECKTLLSFPRFAKAMQILSSELIPKERKTKLWKRLSI